MARTNDEIYDLLLKVAKAIRKAHLHLEEADKP